MIQRVLMTADTVGGVWTYSMDLARVLGKIEVRVLLATMGRGMSEVQRREAQSIRGLEVRESDYKLEWMDTPWKDVEAAGKWLLDLENEFRPDVVHLNGYSHGSLPWSVPTLVVCHSCVLSWWRAVRSEKPGPEWNRYRSQVTEGLRSADLVVAPTSAMLEEVESIYGRLRNSLVIANGREASHFVAESKEPLIFSAGRLWDEAKNIRALENVAASIPWPIYVAGENKTAISTSSNLFYLGQLSPEEVGQWMGRASIYALPAKYEPFGLSILEAARAGCALLLGDIPTLRENWEGVATFIDPSDSTSISAALNHLICDPQCRAGLGLAASKRAERFG